MEVYFLTYADDRFGYKGGKFKENQILLNESAKKCGIKNVVSWTWEEMVKTDFYRQHKEYLDRFVYDNGYVFKPFIVLDLLKKIDYGDIVFYHDCGIDYRIKKSIQPLIDLCIKNKGTLFHQYGDKNSKWTKRDAFVFMNADTPEYYNAPALQATWFLIQKNDFNIKFVEEWLHWNLDERVASSRKNYCGLPQLKGFVAHSYDQSILSILAVKYKIKTFYGVGYGANKDVNTFIALIPKNKFDKIFKLPILIIVMMYSKYKILHKFIPFKIRKLVKNIIHKF